MIDFRDFPTKATEEKLEACDNPKAHYQLGHYYWTIQEIFYGTGKLAHLDDQRHRKELRRDAIWHLHQAKEKGHPRATSEFQEHEKTLGSATVSRMLNTYRQIHRPRS